MQLHTVAIDIENVRAQLAGELNRPVSDDEVSLWLGRCGFVQKNGRWISERPRQAWHRTPHPHRPLAASA
jgi:hypothetical protein